MSVDKTEDVEKIIHQIKEKLNKLIKHFSEHRDDINKIHPFLHERDVKEKTTLYYTSYKIVKFWSTQALNALNELDSLFSEMLDNSCGYSTSDSDCILTWCRMSQYLVMYELLLEPIENTIHFLAPSEICEITQQLDALIVGNFMSKESVMNLLSEQCLMKTQPTKEQIQDTSFLERTLNGTVH